MIIHKINIKTFRAFIDVDIDFNSKVIAIAGQNGTMKSTLLGMLAQPFSLTNKSNEMFNFKTIDGQKFESKFQDKFKISRTKDVVGNHRYTLTVNKEFYLKESFTCISIERNDKGNKSLRFWSEEGRKEGMGFIQCPILFLSLKRLLPIGEEKLIENTTVKLTEEEKSFFISKHNEVLCLNDKIENVDYLISSNKKTLAPSSNNYDAITISAGQDNIGKILLAILSFKRLKENCPKDYKGGILFIDELDATLFPAAQEQLVKFLFRESSKLDLQIIFTTHSLVILKMLLNTPYKHDGRVVYLAKRSEKVISFNNPTFEEIINDLHVISNNHDISIHKINVYCEDNEAYLFAKYILKKYLKQLKFIKVSLGYSNYLNLLKEKIPAFTKSIIILDADAGKKKETKKYKNVVLLPKDNLSPEQMFYSFLKSLEENDNFWDNNLGGYTKQVCFKNYNNEPKDREAYKKWFNEQLSSWGKCGKKLFDRWANENTEAINLFINEFEEVKEKLNKISQYCLR